MKKLRVVFLARYYLPHIGGVEKHLYQICRILKKNNQISLIVEQSDLNSSEFEIIDEIKIYRIPLNQSITESIKKWYIWKWWLSHLPLLFSADVVHIHDVFFWIIPFWPILLWKKVYITFHGYEGSNSPNRKQILWHRLAAFVTRGNICIGDFHRKWYNIKPTFVSYGAIQNIKPNHYVSNIKKEHTAIFIGRDTPDTGLEAYHQLAKRFHLRLDVYTNTPNAAKFLSKYKYAFVSRYLTILEAMAVGIPVFAHYNNSIKYEYLTLAPFAKFIKIFSDPEDSNLNMTFTPRLIIQGQKWAKNQTWIGVVRIYEKLWRI